MNHVALGVVDCHVRTAVSILGAMVHRLVTVCITIGLDRSVPVDVDAESAFAWCWRAIVISQTGRGE